MGPAKTKKGRRTRRLHTINANAAGIDVGSQFHVVAVPEDRDAEPVRTFNSFTDDLHRLAAWLLGCRIDTQTTHAGPRCGARQRAPSGGC